MCNMSLPVAGHLTYRRIITKRGRFCLDPRFRFMRILRTLPTTLSSDFQLLLLRRSFTRGLTYLLVSSKTTPLLQLAFCIRHQIIQIFMAELHRYIVFTASWINNDRTVTNLRPHILHTPYGMECRQFLTSLFSIGRG